MSPLHRSLLALIVVALASGCGDHPCEGLDCGGMMIITLTPTSVTTNVGDTTLVTVDVAGTLDGPPAVAMTSNNTALFRVETPGAGNRSARVIGVAPGSGAAYYTVTSGSQIVAGSVPVTVR